MHEVYLPSNFKAMGFLVFFKEVERKEGRKEGRKEVETQEKAPLILFWCIK